MVAVSEREVGGVSLGSERQLWPGVSGCDPREVPHDLAGVGGDAPRTGQPAELEYFCLGEIDNTVQAASSLERR
jgi:hypothetical protein